MGRFRVAALSLIGLYAAARLAEVAWSRRRAAGRAEREPWWPWMVATHAGVLAGSAAHVLVAGQPPPRWLAVAALSALVAAAALRAWALRALGGRWNVRVVEPGSIVTGGPYRHIRHPNYLAVIVEIAALPLAVGAHWIAAAGSLANALVLSRRIPFEEERLARHPEYAAMMRRPRFLPRWRS